MTTVTCRYEGGLRCRAEHGGSGMELLTDAPLDNHGRGEGFSPTDLVGTALASCILTVMGITAERHGIELEGRSARLDGWISLPGEAHPRGCGADGAALGVNSSSGLQHPQEAGTADSGSKPVSAPSS